MRVVLRFTTAALLLSLVPVSGVWATSQMLSDAKKAGMPAKNCQYCHTETMPKKDSFKPEALNDRGKFLMADKDSRKLKAVDIQKLKDFSGGKEQK
jgi:hypothetical protein